MNRLLLSVLVILTACRGEAPEAESGAAWSGDATWRRVLTIGETDGSEETTFGRIVSLAVTGDGRMLVVDRSVPTVRVFASDGSYLESWGREGQGPGELERPDAGIAILLDGRVVEVVGRIVREP